MKKLLLPLVFALSAFALSSCCGDSASCGGCNTCGSCGTCTSSYSSSACSTGLCGSDWY